jgi:hypothetical protein
MNPQNYQTNTPKAQGTTTPCFVLANPWSDPENYSLPKLLRRVADHIGNLGDDVIVSDLTLYWDRYADWRTNEFDDELTPRVKVYYSRDTE